MALVNPVGQQPVVQQIALVRGVPVWSTHPSIDFYSMYGVIVFPFVLFQLFLCDPQFKGLLCFFPVVRRPLHAGWPWRLTT